jgi:allantoin racemase
MDEEKTMKLLYLVPGPMGRSPEGKAEVERRGDLLKHYAAPGTETGLDDVPEGPASIESMYEEYLSIPATVRRALELEQQGWEALILPPPKNLNAPKDTTSMFSARTQGAA